MQSCSGNLIWCHKLIRNKYMGKTGWPTLSHDSNRPEMRGSLGVEAEAQRAVRLFTLGLGVKQMRHKSQRGCYQLWNLGEGILLGWSSVFSSAEWGFKLNRVQAAVEIIDMIRPCEDDVVRLQSIWAMGGSWHTVSVIHVFLVRWSKQTNCVATQTKSQLIVMHSTYMQYKWVNY